MSEAPAPVKDNTVNISLPSQDIEQPAKVDVPALGSDLSLASGVDASISKPAPVTHSASNTLSASATGASGQLSSPTRTFQILNLPRTKTQRRVKSQIQKLQSRTRK